MIWVAGASGLLGSELARMLVRRGHRVVGTGRETDIRSARTLGAFADSTTERLDWIINCAAYTDVDRAEEEPDPYAELNSAGPENLARTARERGARFLHLSTDYVFDGTADSPYRETDETAPLGVYGRTKRDGELRALDACPDSFIIRTAWLYGEGGGNFVRTMLDAMAVKDRIFVVDDQKGTPTWTRDLASAIAILIERHRDGTPPAPGLYHFSGGGGGTSKFAFALRIQEEGRRLGLLRNECRVEPCPSSRYPSKAERPAYSCLDSAKISRALGMPIPSWTKSLGLFLESRKEAKP